MTHATRFVKVVVEKHPDGYVAYPLGLQGVVVAEGNTVDEAIQNARSAIRFHIETFGREALAGSPTEFVLADVELAARH
jgi:predicted RNase H-like HicB family nuclease